MKQKRSKALSEFTGLRNEIPLDVDYKSVLLRDVLKEAIRNVDINKNSTQAENSDLIAKCVDKYFHAKIMNCLEKMSYEDLDFSLQKERLLLQKERNKLIFIEALMNVKKLMKSEIESKTQQDELNALIDQIQTFFDFGGTEADLLPTSTEELAVKYMRPSVSFATAPNIKFVNADWSCFNELFENPRNETITFVVESRSVNGETNFECFHADIELDGDILEYRQNLFGEFANICSNLHTNAFLNYIHIGNPQSVYDDVQNFSMMVANASPQEIAYAKHLSTSPEHYKEELVEKNVARLCSFFQKYASYSSPDLANLEIKTLMLNENAEEIIKTVFPEKHLRFQNDLDDPEAIDEYVTTEDDVYKQLVSLYENPRTVEINLYGYSTEFSKSELDTNAAIIRIMYLGENNADMFRENLLNFISSLSKGNEQDLPIDIIEDVSINSLVSAESLIDIESHLIGLDALYESAITAFKLMIKACGVGEFVVYDIYGKELKTIKTGRNDLLTPENLEAELEDFDEAGTVIWRKSKDSLADAKDYEDFLSENLGVIDYANSFKTLHQWEYNPMAGDFIITTTKDETIVYEVDEITTIADVLVYLGMIIKPAADLSLAKIINITFEPYEIDEDEKA